MLVPANSESELLTQRINEELADLFRQETEAARAKAHLQEVLRGIDTTIHYIKTRTGELVKKREQICTHDFVPRNHALVSCNLCGLIRNQEENKKHNKDD